MFEKHSLGKKSGNDKKGTLSRRGFLKSSLSLGALGALSAAGGGEAAFRAYDIELFLKERQNRNRFENWNHLSVLEREEKIETEVKEFRDFIRSPEGERIMEEGTDDEIFSVLCSLPAYLREHVRGTKFDVPLEAFPSVAVGRTRTEEGAVAVRSVHDGFDSLKQFYCGNGVPIDANTFITNVHVLEATEYAGSETSGPTTVSDAISRGYQDAGIDVVATSFAEGSDPAICYPTREPACLTLSDDDVHGSLVRVAGIDPDESADSDGVKIFASVALHITPRLFELLKYPENERMNMLNSFLYVLPPGEAYDRLFPSPTGSRLLDFIEGKDMAELTVKRRRRAGGTSGAAVLLGPDAVGINHSCAVLEYTPSNVPYANICLDIGFCHGPKAIQKAMNLNMMYIPSKQAENLPQKTDFGG